MTDAEFPIEQVALDHAKFFPRVAALLIDGLILALAYVVIAVPIWFVAPDYLIFPLETTDTEVLSEQVETEGEKTITTQELRVTYYGFARELGSCRIMHVREQVGSEASYYYTGWQEPIGDCDYLERFDIGLLVNVVLILLYAPLMESSRRQATVGKMVMGLQVRTVDMDRVSFLRAFMRNLAEVLCVLTLTLGYLVCLFTKRRQALHDLLTKTVVVLVGPPTIPNAPDAASSK